jgi:hypothetical protein
MTPPSYFPLRRAEPCARAQDAHARQRAFVLASLLLSQREDPPTHRRAS